jgi:hypothetical protein
MGAPLRRLAEAEGPILLYSCEKCGALWEETMRYSRVISESEARNRYPRFFKTPE